MAGHCQGNEAKVILFSPPINPIISPLIDPNYKTKVQTAIKAIKNKYKVKTLSFDHQLFSLDEYGNADHLNLKGANKVTAMILKSIEL